MPEYFNPTCPHCQVGLEPGFEPGQRNPQNPEALPKWVVGMPEKSKWLGIPTGYWDLADRVILDIVSYRCPKCFRIERFAAPEGSVKENTLLRPASLGKVEEQGLLRPIETSEKPPSNSTALEPKD